MSFCEIKCIRIVLSCLHGSSQNDKIYKPSYVAVTKKKWLSLVINYDIVIILYLKRSLFRSEGQVKVKSSAPVNPLTGPGEESSLLNTESFSNNTRPLPRTISTDGQLSLGTFPPS